MQIMLNSNSDPGGPNKAAGQLSSQVKFAVVAELFLNPRPTWGLLKSLSFSFHMI